MTSFSCGPIVPTCASKASVRDLRVGPQRDSHVRRERSEGYPSSAPAQRRQGIRRVLKQSRDYKARALDKPEIKTMLLLTLATRKIRTSLSTRITPSSECVCSTSSAQKGRIATRSTKFMNSSTWEEKRLSPARRSGTAARGQAGVESRPDSERAISRDTAVAGL